MSVYTHIKINRQYIFIQLYQYPLLVHFKKQYCRVLLFQHAPGIPKVLVGNRLHLAFKRQVHQEEAEDYAERNSMGFFEVSPLVNFNISETLVELARMALRRNGMERWNGRSNKGKRMLFYASLRNCMKCRILLFRPF